MTVTVLVCPQLAAAPRHAVLRRGFDPVVTARLRAADAVRAVAALAQVALAVALALPLAGG